MACPVICVQTKILGVKVREPNKQLPIPKHLDLRYGWPPTHCGLFAVYAAWFLGFNPIYLLGYDGYGTHYVDDVKHDWRNYEAKHEKAIIDFRQYIDKLLEFDQNVNIYNCNPSNAYGNLGVAIFGDLW